MTKLHISQAALQQVQNIIQKLYPNSTVWAYGGRVNGSYHDGSDLDLVVIDFGIEQEGVGALKEAFSNSNIPFLIDVSYWGALPKYFQDEINKGYVVVYDGTVLNKTN